MSGTSQVQRAGTAVASEFTRETLLDLSTRAIGAIHVKRFYPPELAEDAAKKAINHPALGHYHKKYTSSVGRVYMPHIDTKWDPGQIAAYHDAAIPSIHDVRSMFYPCMSPVDQMRLLLQELWPAGANLLRLRGR